MAAVKVFLVDQSSVARKMLSRLLTDAGGFEIVGESGTGEGSLIMLEEDKPDVVFVDAQLKGGLTSSDTIREIKKLNPQTRVILVATPNKRAAIIDGSENGSDDFVGKPFHRSRVLRAISHVMSINDAQ